MTTPGTVSSLQIDVARQILTQAQSQGWARGFQIVESALAQQLGVSRSPVRKALLLLAEQGLVELLPNKGFVVREDMGDPNHLASFARSEADTLRQDLLRDRSLGVIPRDVSENELTERYGVSRGTIRKTLTMLSAEGLVERQRGHGWQFVESLDSRESILESYRFRIAIEPAALKEPGFRADPVALAHLIGEHQKLLADATAPISSGLWLRLNSDFHEAIASWSGNRFIHQAVRMQNNLRMLRESSAFTRLQRPRMEVSLTEHLQILHAIECADFALAGFLLGRHLQSTLDTIEAGL